MQATIKTDQITAYANNDTTTLDTPYDGKIVVDTDNLLEVADQIREEQDNE